jgi:hypothetical protein
LLEEADASLEGKDASPKVMAAATASDGAELAEARFESSAVLTEDPMAVGVVDWRY